MTQYQKCAKPKIDQNNILQIYLFNTIFEHVYLKAIGLCAYMCASRCSSVCVVN